MTTKTLFLRFFLFFVAYLLLIGCFTLQPLQQGAMTVYAKGARSFLSLCLPKAFIRVERNTNPRTALRVLYNDKEQVMAQIEEGNRRGVRNIQVPLEEFNILFPEFFLYSALFFICLVAITPLDLRSKIFAFATGLFLLILFSWLKLLCYTLYHTTNKPIGIYEMTGWAKQFVTNVYVHLKVGIGFLVAVLVWAAVAVSRANWRQLLAAMG